MWTWHWGLFVAAIIPCTALVDFNRSFGQKAATLVGAVVGGVFWAAVVTTIGGFFF
jgi:hypothetical protein